MMNVTITDGRGLPLTCETDGCGCLASTAWYGAWHGKPVLACDAHNPMANTAMSLPLNFTSQSLCRACGQPALEAGQEKARLAGEIIGYEIGGQVWHPSDVTIIRRRDA